MLLSLNQKQNLRRVFLMFDNMQAEDVQQTSNSIKNCKFSTIVMDYLYLQILGALDQESPTFTEARSLRSST